jgi:hypothetical protein
VESKDEGAYSRRVQEKLGDINDLSIALGYVHIGNEKLVETTGD